MSKATPPPSNAAHRSVWVFGWASFLHDMGADMIFSIWPIFLTEVLGANKAIVGLIDGLGDAMVSVAQAISGYWSDRLRKRKVFVWMGYLFGGVAKIGYALAVSWVWILPFRILDRSGKMRGAPRDAIVSDLSTSLNRGRHFGILRMMDYSGAVIGIVLSLILVRFLPLRWMIALAAIPSLLAVLLVLRAYREETPAAGRVFQGIQWKDFTPNLRLYFVVSALFTLGSFSYSFLLLTLKPLGFPLAIIPAFYLLYSAVASIFSLPFGKLADRIGRKPVLLFAFVCWVVVALGCMWMQSTVAVLMVFFLYGIHIAALEPVQKALAAELAPSHLVGSTLGAYQLIVGFASLPASLLAGILWDQFGMAFPFFLSIILTAVAGVLLMFLKDGGKESNGVTE